MDHNNQLSNYGGGRSRRDSPQIAATKLFSKIDPERLKGSVLARLNPNYLVVRNYLMELVEEYGNADMLLKDRRHMTSQDYNTIINAFTTTQAINLRRDQLTVTVRNYQDEVNAQRTKQAAILAECVVNKSQISQAILQKDNSAMASLFPELTDLDAKHEEGARLLKQGEQHLANSLSLLEEQETKVKINSSSAPKPPIPPTPVNGGASSYETPANPASGVHNIASSIQGAMPPSPSTASHPSSSPDTRRALTPMDEADNYLKRQIAKSHVFYEKFDDEDPNNAILENHSDSVDRQVTWKLLCNCMSNSKDVIDKIVTGDCRALYLKISSIHSAVGHTQRTLAHLDFGGLHMSKGETFSKYYRRWANGLFQLQCTGYDPPVRAQISGLLAGLTLREDFSRDADVDRLHKLSTVAEVVTELQKHEFDLRDKQKLLEMQRDRDSRHRSTAYHASTVHDESDEEEASQAEERTPSNPGPRECRSYAKHNSCPFGKHCKYKHKGGSSSNSTIVPHAYICPKCKVTGDHWFNRCPTTATSTKGAHDAAAAIAIPPDQAAPAAGNSPAPAYGPEDAEDAPSDSASHAYVTPAHSHCSSGEFVFFNFPDDAETASIAVSSNASKGIGDTGVRAT
jgi:hypothetical protein